VFEDQRAARRWTLPLSKLDGSVERLVIWDVPRLMEDEIRALEDWVSRGGVVLLGGRPDGLPGAWQVRLRTGEAGAARPAAPHPVTVGIRTVSVGSARFTGDVGDRLVHLKDADGRPVLISWRIGKGRVFWSADTDWLSNAHIGEEQNLDLALQILWPPGGGQVAFDEYHHGFTSPIHWWQVLRGPLRVSVALLGLAVVLLFWAYGARFGSPRPVPARPPRAAVEYVHSMSQLYRRARAAEVVLRALYRSLRTHLGRLTGSVAELPHDEIAHRAAARCGVPEKEIEQLLDRVSASTPPQSDLELVTLARAVESLQRRIDHAGHRYR